MVARAQDLQSKSDRDDAGNTVLRDKVAAAEEHMFVAQDDLAVSRQEVKELKVVVTAATAEYIRFKKRLVEVHIHPSLSHWGHFTHTVRMSS
jgi:hypothetical protein